MKKKSNTPRTDRKIKSLRQPIDHDVSAVESQASFDALAEWARKLEKENRSLKNKFTPIGYEKLKPLIGRDGSVFL